MGLRAREVGEDLNVDAKSPNLIMLSLLLILAPLESVGDVLCGEFVIYLKFTCGEDVSDGQLAQAKRSGGEHYGWWRAGSSYQTINVKHTVISVIQQEGITQTAVLSALALMDLLGAMVCACGIA